MMKEVKMMLQMPELIVFDSRVTKKFIDRNEVKRPTYWSILSGMKTLYLK